MTNIEHQCDTDAMTFPVPQRDEFPAGLHAPTALAPMHVVTEIRGRGGILAPGVPRCHRCETPATMQWRRKATAAEAEQHWAAQEQHIRSIPDLFGHGNATWTADHSDDVVKAVHGCDAHLVNDTLLLHAADCGGHGACQCEGATQNG